MRQRAPCGSCGLLRAFFTEGPFDRDQPIAEFEQVATFGFDAPAEKLSEVGERLGVSAERVRQIEERALAKLRSAA